MNDIKHFLNIVEGVPSTFTATHFHKNNFGGKTSLMYNPEDGKFYFQRDGEIERWNGNVNSRSRMNPASVDGEIVDGKFVDYPEGKTFADMEKEKASNAASADAANSTSPWGGRPQERPQQGSVPGVVPGPGGMDGAPPASSPRPQERPATRGMGSSSNSPTPGVQGDRLTLSDGSSFRKEPNSQNLLNQKTSELVNRMLALLRKMNESVPVSMRGYIVESGIAELLLEALTDAETQELKTIYADLRAIEKSEFLLRPANQQNLKRFLDREGAKIDALVVAAGGNAPGASGGDTGVTVGGPINTDVPQATELPPAASGDAAAANASTTPGLDSATTPQGSSDSTPAAQANPDGGETPASDTPATSSSDTDFSSDESIQKAIKDPEGWISNEMPKELAKYNARGLSKASRGRKSASVAAVQQVMKRINAVTRDSVFDIETDGKMGSKTRDAVKAAQRLAGITVDGDPGADTAKQLVDFAKNPTSAGGIGEKRILQDVEKAIELLKKQNEGTPTQQNSSIDFRDLIRIVESKLLNEALSDNEKKELDDILARLKAKLDDGEYIDGLKDSNPDLHTKFKELQQLQSGRTAPAASSTTPNPAADAQADDAASPPLSGPADPRSAAAVAADTDRDGNADDPEAQVFTQDTPTAALKIWRAPGVMNDDENAVFTVMRDVVKSERAWTRLQQDFKNLPQNRNKIELVPYLEDFLNDGEMTRYVWDPLATNGVRPRGANGSSNSNSDRPTRGPTIMPVPNGRRGDPAADAQASAPATSNRNNVTPRPTGGGRTVRAQQMTWDRQHAATHNPDGTPKAAAPAQQAPAQAPAAAPTTAAAPATSNNLQSLRDELQRLDKTKKEESTRWIQILIQNPELMGEMEPEVQRRVRAAAEALGIR